jgi:4-amino-4-deoxy-L-arabinose transferase-like glycosyltransferase
LRFWIILLAALLLRSVFFVGFALGDDLAYVSRVNEILSGHYPQLDPLNQYAYRPLLLYLFTGGVAVFGHTDFGVVAPVLLCSLLTVAIVYGFARTLVHADAAAWCAVLFAFEPFNVINSTTMTNDVVLACLTFGAVTLFLEADRQVLRRSSDGLNIAAGVLMVAAFLTKITMLPALVALGIYSLARLRSAGAAVVRAHSPFYATFLAGMILVCLVYYLKAGDPFWQFRAETQYYETYKPDWYKSGAIDYPYLMWQYPRSLFGRSGYEDFTYREHGWLFWLFLPAAVAAVRRPANGILRFLVLFVCVVFAFFEFYPQYVRPYYLPLVRQERYLEMLVPAAVIVVGWWLYELSRRQRVVAGIALCVFLGDAMWQASRRSELYNDSQQDLRALGAYARSTVAPTGKRLGVDVPARNALAFYVDRTPIQLESLEQDDVQDFAGGYIAVGGARSFWWSKEFTLRMPRQDVPDDWVLTFEVPGTRRPWRDSSLRVYYVPDRNSR